MVGVEEFRERLNQLTAKQRAALDLLVQHKTSKEISRELGISPHTVDQRIDSAKRILGSSTRGDLAQRYLQLREACEGMTYEQLVIAEPRKLVASEDSERPMDGNGAIVQGRPGSALNARAQPDHRVGPELFYGPGGTIFRVLAIILVALFVAMTTLAVMAIFSETAKVLS